MEADSTHSPASSLKPDSRKSERASQIGSGRGFAILAWLPSLVGARRQATERLFDIGFELVPITTGELRDFLLTACGDAVYWGCSAAVLPGCAHADPFARSFRWAKH